MDANSCNDCECKNITRLLDKLMQIIELRSNNNCHSECNCRKNQNNNRDRCNATRTCCDCFYDCDFGYNDDPVSNNIDINATDFDIIIYGKVNGNTIDAAYYKRTDKPPYPRPLNSVEYNNGTVSISGLGMPAYYFVNGKINGKPMNAVANSNEYNVEEIYVQYDNDDKTVIKVTFKIPHTRRIDSKFTFQLNFKEDTEPSNFYAIPYSCRNPEVTSFKSLLENSFDTSINNAHITRTKYTLTLTNVHVYGLWDTGYDDVKDNLRSIRLHNDIQGIDISDNVTLPDDSIGDFAFINCRNLLAIILPEGLTHIGDAAFANCMNLLFIISPSVTHIGDAAFANCTSLLIAAFIKMQSGRMQRFVPSRAADTEIENEEQSLETLRIELLEALQQEIRKELQQEIQQEIQEEPTRAQVDLMLLEQYFGVISNTLECIGELAFANCTSLIRVILPRAPLQGIGDAAFANCTWLLRVMLTYTPNRCKHIFFNCPLLQHFSFTASARFF